MENISRFNDSSGASQTSTPPPALPSRAFRQPPQVPKHPNADHNLRRRSAVELIRSNSMDRSYFKHNHLQPVNFENSDSLDNKNNFPVSAASGRHSHVFSPTQETLREHNLMGEGLKPTISSPVRQLEQFLYCYNFPDPIGYL